MRSILPAFLLSLALIATASAQNPAYTTEGVPDFDVRPGYRVTMAADDIKGARFLEFDDKGTLFVSLPREGRILACRDEDGDGVYEKRTTFVEGWDTAHGMHFVDGWLWFTQSRAIHRARDEDGDGVADTTETILGEGTLPGGGGHWWRPILVTDQHIFTGVGDSGNIDDELTSSERQKIFRFNRDGSNKTLYATGIRNTEKLRLRPGTDEVWGCDHGSDWYGAFLERKPGIDHGQPITNRNPPDELNHYRLGEFYGHPFIVGDLLPRPEYFDREDLVELAAKTVWPEWNFGAHWATNGFCFITGDHFPADHQGDLFAACHGSWNSSTKVGYRIERVLFDKVTGKPYGSLSIVGTLGSDGNTVLARPVDCVIAPDGALLWSCDHTGRIFRIEVVGG